MKQSMFSTICRMTAATLCIVVAGNAAAQQQQQGLTKQIELEKEVVVVEKKATKKNNLPTPAPAATATPPSQLQFSDNAVVTDVPATIPTMQPYGYRTLHNFSNSRGYFDFGGGSHANFTGSLGYRIIDSKATKLSAWLQHNSTWAGRNTTGVEQQWQGTNAEVIDGYFDRPVKQKFNDNLLGIDFSHSITPGTFTATARLHFDSFNYYGGRTFVRNNVSTQQGGLHYAPDLPTIDWDDLKQSYTAADLSLGWEGNIAMGDRALGYNATLSLGYAALSKALDTRHDKGAKDFDLRLDLGASYAFNDNLAVGLDLGLQRNAFNNRANDNADYIGRYYNKRNKLLFTALPNIAYRGGNVSLRAGLRIDVTNKDAEIYETAPTVRLSPELDLDVAIAQGVGLFATATGGRSIERITDAHDNYRYVNPNTALAVPYTPVDARAGLNIGPFAGFSARPFVGYGVTKFTNNAMIMPMDEYTAALMGLTMQNVVVDCAGMYFGAELEYKYRSLLEARVKLAYAMQDDDVDAAHGYSNHLAGTMAVAGMSLLNRTGVTYNGYWIDDLGSQFRLDVAVDVHPIKKLTIGVGLDLRTGIGVFTPGFEAMHIDRTTNQPMVNLNSVVDIIDLENIINLKAHARYQFNKSLAVWLKADNLLGRHYDLYYGMGAQRFAIIGGLAVNF